MKQFSLFAALLLVMSLTLTNCKENSNIPSPGDNSYNLPTQPAPIVDAIEINIDSAEKIVNALAENETTTQQYRIKGIVSKNTTYPFSVPSLYTNIDFNCTDNSTETALTCYRTLNLRKRDFTSASQVPLIGSEVTVVGQLTKYNGSPELKNGFIESHQNFIGACNINDLPACPKPLEDQISIEEANAIGKTLGSGGTSSTTYKIVGIVHAIYEAPSSFNNATFTISDKESKASFYGYRVKAKTSSFSNPAMLAVGDTVFIESKITNYKGTIETVSNQGYIYWSSNKLLFPTE